MKNSIDKGMIAKSALFALLAISWLFFDPSAEGILLSFFWLAAAGYCFYRRHRPFTAEEAKKFSGGSVTGGG